MKRQQRLNAIIKYLESNPVVSVSNLSKIFDVSDVTMRRDLNELQRRKLVKRMHGSVMLYPQDDISIPGFRQKALENVHEKKLIAQAAADLVAEGTLIFVNGGSTTYEFISRICDKNVTIVTNNAITVNLIDDANARLIITGGEYNSTAYTFSGELTVRFLSTINADMCFLGTNGISATGGLSTYYHEESNINTEMIRKCHGPLVVMADHSKIGKTYHFTNECLDRIDYLITDKKADADELQAISKNRAIKIIKK